MKYQACTISTYDFSTLYTTLPHILIQSKLTHLIEKRFARENKLFLACNTERGFFTNDTVKYYTMLTCLDVCKLLSFLLDNLYIYIVKLLVSLWVQTVRPLSRICLNCYERDSY